MGFPQLGLESHDLLSADDDIYGLLPGIAHRGGDAAVTIQWMADGESEGRRFLINGAQRRSGAISIP